MRFLRSCLPVYLILVLSYFLLNSSSEAKELATPQEIQYFDNLLKKRNRYFPRQLRTFKLNNGIEVLLIHDPREKMASVSLDVHVGMYSDPKEYPGLAHYLEHMLFLGTKKYPQPGEFMDFVSKNTGYTNAFTTADHTNYQFQVAPSSFDQALDRFSQFFIQPKFDLRYIEKELENVESEYKKNLENNIFRVLHLSNILSNPAHPQSRVFQGNKESLKKIPRSALVDFFKAHYRGNRMKVAILSPLETHRVEKQVRKAFAGIQSSSKVVNNLTDAPIFLQKDLPRLVEVQSIGDYDELVLFFPTPSLFNFRYSKPFDHLISLLTREDEGSFKRILQQKGWITHLYAGLVTNTDKESIFIVNFSLPKARRSQWQEPCAAFFGFIEFLKNQGLTQEFYEDAKKKAELQFEFSSQQGGIQEVSSLAHQMHISSPLRIEAEERTYPRYSKQAFQEVLQRIHPQNLQILRMRPDLEGKNFENKYQIHYSVSPIEASVLQSWKETKVDPQISYPKPNPYLPKNLDLIGTPQPVPQQLKNDSGQRLWVQVDHSFELPKAILYYEFYSEPPATPYDAALRQLYQVAVGKSHSEWKALTLEAGSWAAYGQTNSGFNVTLSGYSDRLKEFATDFITKLPIINISEHEFEIQKNEMIRQIENEKFADPYVIASIRADLLSNPHWYLSKDLLPELKKITLNNVKEFAKSPFRKVFLRGYGFGNTSGEMVTEVARQFQKQFRLEPLQAEIKPKYEAIQLPSGKSFHYRENSEGKNNAWVLFYQFGKTSPELEVAIQVGHSILSHPFFHEIRTQRGIGYIAQALTSIDSVSSNLKFVIQSDRAFPDFVPLAEDWIQQAVQKIDQVSEQEFRQIKNTLLETLRKQPSTFEEKSYEVFQALFIYQGDLQWKEKRIRALEALTPHQVAEIFKKALDPKNRSQLSVFIQSKEGVSKKFERGSEEEILDVNQFKRQRSRYSVEF